MKTIESILNLANSHADLFANNNEMERERLESVVSIDCNDGGPGFTSEYSSNNNNNHSSPSNDRSFDANLGNVSNISDDMLECFTNSPPVIDNLSRGVSGMEGDRDNNDGEEEIRFGAGVFLLSKNRSSICP